MINARVPDQFLFSSLFRSFEQRRLFSVNSVILNSFCNKEIIDLRLHEAGKHKPRMKPVRISTG